MHSVNQPQREVMSTHIIDITQGDDNNKHIYTLPNKRSSSAWSNLNTLQLVTLKSIMDTQINMKHLSKQCLKGCWESTPEEAGSIFYIFDNIVRIMHAG